MITTLLRRNRLRKQKGQRVETANAFCFRYYVDGRQKFITLAHKGGQYRSWNDVEPLIESILRAVNEGVVSANPRQTLTEFVEQHYLPWVKETKAAATFSDYARRWKYWKADVGDVALTDLQTADVTVILTKHAKDGKGVRALAHLKWMLSGAYQYAVASGIVTKNPVPEAKWLVKTARVKKQPEYSLDDVLAMLRVLEPIDIRAAAAVALAYFAALRPAEIRGLKWEDYDGSELHIKRAIWQNVVGETKTEGSAASVPVIEPLRSLLEKLRAQSTTGYMIQNAAGNPMLLDSLSVRVIAPALKKAGIKWHSYYPCRRGISSRVTDTSKNALNSTGLLHHSTPGTGLTYYTRAQKDSIAAAMKTVEEDAAEIIEKQKQERVQ